jgi:hypothetical protein
VAPDYNPAVARPQSPPETGLDPVVEAYKAGIDRTLLRENRRLSVEERFVQLMRLQRNAEELRRAGRPLRKPR